MDDYGTHRVQVSTILKSEIPIIYINFSDAKYPIELKKYLEKRIQIIKGWYDVNNKAQMKWDKLGDFIKFSQKKKDTTIYNLIFIAYNEREIKLKKN